MRAAVLRIAWKEFAGSLARFRIFLACLGVGAFAIAASGSVTASFREGVTNEARMLLGGDIGFSGAQRMARPEELAFMETLGDVSQTATLRIMAQSGENRRQADLRVVDEAFPLLGEVVLSGGADTLAEALAERDGRWGIAVSHTFLEQLKVGVGDDVMLGSIPARVTAILESEPDRLGASGAFEPSALAHIKAAREAGRLDAGMLFRSNYLVELSRTRDLDVLEDEMLSVLGEDSLRLRRPEDAVDGLQELLDLLNSFLAVVGVASLVAGGIGIAQATGAFLESRIGSISALKAFGASASDIRWIYLLQLGALSLLGAGIGVGLGALAPFALSAFADDAIPLPQTLAIYPGPLGYALALSVLAAAAFALPALGRARATPPAALFRKIEPSGQGLFASPERIAAIGACVLLVLVATLLSPRPLMTFGLLAGAGFCYLILTGAAQIIRRLAHRSAKTARGTRRLMLSNLGGPGSLAPLIAPAIGLGVALLTLVTCVQANLLRQIGETAPANLPSLVFSQIPNRDAPQFDQLLADQGVDIADPESYRRIPMMLARITSLRGEPLVEENVAESERWVIGREIQVTYLAEMPSEVELTKGEWWPSDYEGPPLVSIEAGVARGLNLDIGDRVGFRIFGREVEADVASIRKVAWDGFGVNRAFIFSPGQISTANPQNFAIAQVPPEAEQPIIDALGESFPDIIVFQTRQALATAEKVVGDISVAVSAIASVVTVAGLLVLAGALATIARKRQTESALLKTIGATRGRIIGLYTGELGLAGGCGVLIGVVFGVVAAWIIVVNTFEARWFLPMWPIIIISVTALSVSSLGGAGAGYMLLSKSAARVLRAQ